MSDFDAELADVMAERELQPNPLLAGLRTGDWLDAQVFPPLSYVVPGLIPKGLSTLVGAPKIGKSWLSLAVALAAASGGCALGHVKVGPPRPVLLLALEDGDRRLQDRIRKLIPWESIPPLLHYMTRIQPGMVVPTIEAWLATIDHPEPLAILDTLGKILPPAMNGETTYQRDYKIASRLKEICDNRPGMSLTGLHHDRKAAAEDFVESVSGTNGLAGAADTIIVISRPRNESQGLLKVTGRDVAEAEYAVTTKDGNWLLMGGNLEDAASVAATIRATANLGDRSAEILRFVNKHPRGVRAGDVAKALGDIDAQKAGTYLGRLHNSGKVRKLERGLYTPVESVETVELAGQETLDFNTLNTFNTTSRAEGSSGDAPKVTGDLADFDPSNPCPICGEPYEDPSGNEQCIDNHPETTEVQRLDATAEKSDLMSRRVRVKGGQVRSTYRGWAIAEWPYAPTDHTRPRIARPSGVLQQLRPELLRSDAHRD
jgi:hypothetical protein